MTFEEVGGKTRIVGNWQPTKLESAIIRIEFREEILRLFGIDLDRLVRPSGPSHRVFDFWVREPNSDSLPRYFHQDGAGETKYSLVWSNVYPTEIRYLADRKTFLDAKRGDIILIDNNEVQHRTPDFPPQTERWFVRVYGFERWKTIGK